MTKIGILHPGEMGVSVAACAIQSGHEVYWCSAQRSQDTHKRAEQHGLIELPALKDLCQVCSTIVSVCPPHAAEAVAGQVVEAGFQGTYLEANAISPGRAIRVSERLLAASLHFVDGAIIGGPAWTPGTTWLFLSGHGAGQVADLFRGSPLETQILGHEIGKASALKMCYAALSKGTTALLAGILATAEALQVRSALEQHWDREQPGASEQTHERVIRAVRKAWRFEGEMREIAATFTQAGLPGEFHNAAAEVYRRLASLGQGSQPAGLAELLDVLREKPAPLNASDRPAGACRSPVIEGAILRTSSYSPTRQAAMRKVIIETKRNILDDFFKVEEAYLQFEQFDGQLSPRVRRLSIERGNSVGVLVLNRDTDKLILVSQFRYPTYQNGHGWTIEAIAGMVDPGETPEQTIQRELQEETGLVIHKFEPIATFYPSPGGSSELIYLFYSEVSGDQARYQETGGLLGHGENVKAIELSLEEALAMVKSGEIVDAKTVAGLFWLEGRRLQPKPTKTVS